MIKRRRESLGFSQARLGDLVGRSASTIRNWERGKSTPAAPSDAVALAAVLGLDETRVVEAAGFQMDEVETHQSVEQGYASLAPQPSDDPEHVAPSGDGRQAPGSEPEVRVAPVSLPSREESQPPAEEEASEPVAEVEQQERPPESRPASPQGRGDPEITPFSLGPVPEEGREQREVSRAAPPTVLEVASQGEPSYLEDPEERQRYRVRALATAAVVVFLVIVLLWSFDRTTDALGTMWSEFMGMLEL